MPIYCVSPTMTRARRMKNCGAARDSPTVYLPSSRAALIIPLCKSHQARSTVPFHGFTTHLVKGSGSRKETADILGGKLWRLGPIHWGTFACTEAPRVDQEHMWSKKGTICDWFVDIDATRTLRFGLASGRRRSAAGHQSAQLDDNEAPKASS